MPFERIQMQQHKIENRVLTASYDRFTTRFSLCLDGAPLYHCYLIWAPVRRAVIDVAGLPLKLHITWLLLWRAKLINANTTFVDELLSTRRKKSINLMIYLSLLTSIKLAVVLLAKV